MLRKLKKSALVMGPVSAFVVLIALMAPSPAMAEYCVNQQVNNVQKCWGPEQLMEANFATGQSTGVCVGYDTVNGPCSPVGQMAFMSVPYGRHLPWVRGTASSLTHFNATAY